MKRNKELGDCFWIEPISNKRVALITTRVNVGALNIDDLTDEQRRNAGIHIFNTRKEAEAARVEMILANIKPLTQ